MNSGGKAFHMENKTVFSSAMLVYLGVYLDFVNLLLFFTSE